MKIRAHDNIEFGGVNFYVRDISSAADRRHFAVCCVLAILTIFMKGALQINESSTPPLNAAPAAQLELKRPLVLVVDTDEDNRLQLKMLLDLYGIVVLEARDGEEAIDLTVRERPDLVLINADLPRLDGFETTRLIRNIRSFDRMPIVFLSARTEHALRKRAFAVGGDGFHIEPLDIDRLDQLLEKFLLLAGDFDGYQ